MIYIVYLKKKRISALCDINRKFAYTCDINPRSVIQDFISHYFPALFWWYITPLFPYLVWPNLTWKYDKKTIKIPNMIFCIHQWLNSSVYRFKKKIQAKCVRKCLVYVFIKIVIFYIFINIITLFLWPNGDFNITEWYIESCLGIKKMIESKAINWLNLILWTVL